MKQFRIFLILLTIAFVIGACTFRVPKQQNHQKQGLTGSTETSVSVIPIEKIVIVPEENHSYAQMRAQMPWLKSMGDKYGYFTNYKGNLHPSYGNYIIMLSGDAHGVTSDTLKKIKGPTVMGDAIAAGYKAKMTADDMGKSNRCKTSNVGSYYARHAGWPSFTDEAGICHSYDYDYAYWSGDAAAGKIGNIHFLIPSVKHDAHSASLKAADDWLKGALGYLMRGPDWLSGKELILVTADEDDKKNGQSIYTVAMNPQLDHKVVTSNADHYALNKMLYALIHKSPRGTKAQTAPDLWSALGLTFK